MSEVLADAGMLSLTALTLKKDEDRFLPGGTHLRWHLSPELGLPHAGFRIRRRPAPVWPWPKSETRKVGLTRHNVATSAAGVHFTNVPMRVENAIVTSDFGLRCQSRQPMRFFYEQREQHDPNFQPWVRFAVVLESERRFARTQVKLRGFARHGERTIEVAEMRKPFRSLPIVHHRGKMRRAIYISAAEMQSVWLEFGEGLVVREIRYCTADFLHQQRDWETLTVLPPLCQERTPDVVSPGNLRQMAFQRLRDLRPLRRPTDPAAPGKGKQLSTRDHLLFARGLLRQAETLAQSISTAFKTEITNKQPPGTITVSEVDNSPLVSSNGMEGDMSIPFYGLLQASAFDSHTAALLGLAYHDESGWQDSEVENETYDGWDYAVDAVVSSLWLYLAQMTPEARSNANLERVPKALLAHGNEADIWNQEPPGFKRVFACALNQKTGVAKPVQVPGVQASDQPDATNSPVQASVTVSLLMRNRGVRPLLWRKDGREIKVLSPKDPVTGLLSPAMANGQQVMTFSDNSLNQYGLKRYQAVNIDLFGRASEIATATCRVKDQVAPPAPSSLTIQLGESDPADENAFSAATVSFRWTDTMNASAQDLEKFHIYWRSGFWDADDVVASPESTVSIGWPLDASQRHDRENNGLTIYHELTMKTERNQHRRQVTAVCVAEDASGNLSQPSQAVQAVLVDEIKPLPPAQPDEPQWTAWPDANMEARWRCRWSLPSNATAARISTASETRLLNLAGVDKQHHYAQPPNERAMALKQLAVTTPQAFTPEALGYPADISHHDVVLKAGSRDFKVVVVEYIGATGQKSDWPANSDSFAVIRARSLEPLSVPGLRVSIDNNEASLELTTNGQGEVEIYAVYGPTELAKLAFLAPIATLAVDQLSALQHQPDTDAEWVGYVARLSHPSGRFSEYSAPVWRQIRLSS